MYIDKIIIPKINSQLSEKGKSISSERNQYNTKSEKKNRSVYHAFFICILWILLVVSAGSLNKLEFQGHRAGVNLPILIAIIFCILWFRKNKQKLFKIEKVFYYVLVIWAGLYSLSGTLGEITYIIGLNYNLGEGMGLFIAPILFYYFIIKAESPTKENESKHEDNYTYPQNLDQWLN